MAAVAELDRIYEGLTPHFMLIGGAPGVELCDFPETGGQRVIRGRMNNNKELLSVAPRYDQNTEKWGLTKSEMTYLLQKARDDVFQEGDNVSAYRVTTPNIGEYFNIEGHRNFLKGVIPEADDRLRLACGTGNNTYFREYEGQFYEFHDDRRTYVYLNGVRKTMNTMDDKKPEHSDSGVILLYTIPFYSNYYHTYR